MNNDEIVFWSIVSLAFVIVGVGWSVGLMFIGKSIHAVAMAMHSLATAVTATSLTNRGR